MTTPEGPEPIDQLTQDEWALYRPPDTLSDELIARAEAEVEALTFRPAPRWLGSFGILCFGEGYGHRRQLPPACREVAIIVQRKIWEIYGGPSVPNPNAAFVQRYEPGFVVKKHVDPKSNKGITAILTLGRFHPGPTVRIWPKSGNHHPHSVQPNHADILVLPCTINGEQGPAHAVTGHFLQEGVRYAIILNHIQL
jgi:hypothetical protein